jgi:G3E family GTPase
VLLPATHLLFTAKMVAALSAQCSSCIHNNECLLLSKMQYWCVIVNEFGAVGIDAVALQSSAAAAGGTVTVKQIAGGCMCCTQSGVLLPAIAQIIRQTKPDRLLIEPSGLGHPAGDRL